MPHFTKGSSSCKLIKRFENLLNHFLHHSPTLEWSPKGSKGGNWVEHLPWWLIQMCLQKNLLRLLFLLFLWRAYFKLELPSDPRHLVYFFIHSDTVRYRKKETNEKHTQLILRWLDLIVACIATSQLGSYSWCLGGYNTPCRNDTLKLSIIMQKWNNQPITSRFPGSDVTGRH